MEVKNQDEIPSMASSVETEPEPSRILDLTIKILKSADVQYFHEKGEFIFRNESIQTVHFVAQLHQIIRSEAGQPQQLVWDDTTNRMASSLPPIDNRSDIEWDEKLPSVLGYFDVWTTLRYCSWSAAEKIELQLLHVQKIQDWNAITCWMLNVIHNDCTSKAKLLHSSPSRDVPAEEISQARYRAHEKKRSMTIS